MYRTLLFCLFFTVSVESFTQTNPLFDESKVEIVPININTDESEFGPFLIGKSFYYTSSQERKIGVISMESATNHQMLDLYTGIATDSIRINKVKALNDDINTPLNQGGCFFDKYSSKLYYSSDIECAAASQKYKLAIFSAELINNQFGTPKTELVLPDTFSAAHPVIFKGKLYFSANTLSGKGKTDIYMAEKVGESWGNFTNCSYLNSEENEFFPFVINENEIYFSSNRPGGLGKLDLYKYTNNGVNSFIQNAGAPLNSEYDDFAIYVDSLQEKGYFSTNREDHQDDIYFYTQTWPTFTNCKESIPEDYCYNLSEENTLDTDRALGYYYEWLFGDGTKQKGLSVRHCFPGPGNYIINLNIIDSVTKSIFLSQATFDLKVDSIIQLKINCLDTVPAHKTFAINTQGTYLPDNKIEGYYFEIAESRVRGNQTKHSFSKTGTYKILLGVITFNTKTNKKELLCTTKNIVVVDQNKWPPIEARIFKEELSDYAYRAFKTDSSKQMSLISDSDIELYNKIGLNGKKLVTQVKVMLAALAGQKIIVDEVAESGKAKFTYVPMRIDTLLRLLEQDEVTFKVHFGTSKVKKDTTLLSSKGIMGINEKAINNEYHYTYGNEKKLNDIERYYQKSLNAGVKNPVVIGYKNDQIIFDQSANIHPATFEENKLNVIKDSVLVSSPQNYIENKNAEPLNNTTTENANSPVTESQKNNTSNEKQAIENTAEKTQNETQTTVTEQKTKTENTVAVKNNEKINTTEPVSTSKTTAKKNQANEKSLIDPNENLNISTEGEFNSLTNIQKKMKWFLDKYGDISMDDLEFKVQVGAFRKRRSYDFPNLAGMGKIENEHLENGVTRMTIGGSFKKLSEAFSFVRKIIAAGQDDAFVSVFYKGKRVYIENLERKGIIGNKEEASYTIFKETHKAERPSESNSDFTKENLNYTESNEFIARTNIQKKTILFAQKYGNISADELEFKVQIAVFKFRKNYDFPRLKKFGIIEVEQLGNDVVRVTVGGNFKTLNGAFELNKKVVMAGQTDAFVSVFYKGKRIYIENLEQKGIFVVNKNK